MPAALPITLSFQGEQTLVIHSRLPPPVPLLPPLLQVKLLINEGGADIFVRDRWGYTPLDEARRVGALPVVNFLESCMAVKRPGNLEGLDGWGI